MSIKGSTKLNLTPKEKQALGTYILAHCSIPPGSEFAKWDEESGGSDISVAEKLKASIPKLTVFHVRYLRQSFDLKFEPTRLKFVNLKREEKLTDYQALRDKIEALAAHVHASDNLIKDQAERIRVLESEDRGLDLRMRALEDKYTAPKR